MKLHPGVVVLGWVEVDSFIGSTVDSSIGLSVAGDARRGDGHRPVDEVFDERASRASFGSQPANWPGMNRKQLHITNVPQNQGSVVSDQGQGQGRGR